MVELAFSLTADGNTGDPKPDVNWRCSKEIRYQPSARLDSIHDQDNTDRTTPHRLSVGTSELSTAMASCS